MKAGPDGPEQRTADHDEWVSSEYERLELETQFADEFEYGTDELVSLCKELTP